MLKISRTELDTYLRCSKKYDYAFRQEAGGTIVSEAMAEGTLGHVGLAAGYANGFAGFTAAALLAMAETVKLGTTKYRGQDQKLGLTPEFHKENITRIGDCVQFYAQQNIESDFQQYEVLAVEQEFSTTLHVLGHDVELSGVLDLVAHDKTYTHKRMATIFDHKFVGSVTNAVDFLPLDLQMLIYEYLVWKRLVVDTKQFDDVEVKYNMIRREVPPGFGSRPLKRNLDGSISKANASQDPRDYLRRATIYHSTRQRQAILDNHLIPSLEEYIEATQNPKRWVRRPIKTGGEACSNCSWSKRCAAEIIGFGTPRIGVPESDFQNA